MSPLPSSGEIYGLHFLADNADVDILLPNGLFLTLNVNRNIALNDLKIRAWDSARVQGCNYDLKELDKYMFCGINQDGEEEIYFNENRKLCDLRLCQVLFKIVEFSGNKEENFLNSEISQCIGMSVYDLNKEAVDEEVLAFRRRLVRIANQAFKEQNLDQPYGLLRYLFSAQICSTIPCSVRMILQNKDYLAIYASSEAQPNAKLLITLSKQSSVEDVIQIILQKLEGLVIKSSKSSSIKSGSSQKLDSVGGGSVGGNKTKDNNNTLKNYILKACCDNSYFMDLKQLLIQYKYIQNCLSEQDTPLLHVMSLTNLYKLHKNVTNTCQNSMILPSYANWGLRSYENLETRDFTSLWDVNDFFKINIRNCTYVNVKDPCNLFVRVGIFHGCEPLTTPLETNEKVSTHPTWNKWLHFDIHLVDLPRAAKLCICVIQRSTDKKARVPDSCLGWANVSIFDHLGYLLSGQISLTLLPLCSSSTTTTSVRSDFLNPIKPCQRPSCVRGGSGGVGGNLDNNKSSTSPSTDHMQLILEFMEKCQPPIRFPRYDIVMETAMEVHSSEPNTSHLYNSNRREIMTTIAEIIQRDPLSELSEQEKSTLWQYRDLCMELPESLPRLTESVKWKLQKDVLLFYHLLNKWPSVTRETAINLLGHTNADPRLRSFAVFHLKQRMDHNDIDHFLLQLIQCIKMEPYLFNDLTEFILIEALKNSQLGLKLFWNLRSEMHEPSVRLRFGIILEGFCRGCGNFLSILRKQTEVVDKLTILSICIKTQREEEQVKFFHEKMTQEDMLDTLVDFYSPLDHHMSHGKLEVNMCDIKKSKKRPLWLVWCNSDLQAMKHISHHRMIFKMGDDLRQDMLTLQMLRLIDLIWKEEGKDLHLIPYGCLATGNETGLIEAVRDALTVMAIQRKQLKSALQLDHTMLHKWLQSNNKTQAEYESAIDIFTRSCAGYCVATFVLGIRDRHPDNIMLNRRGQLFHIDFGHFLNNRKKKFGINREKVPFVLTEDFAYVIARGCDNPKRTKEFSEFSKTCSTAYLALRKHSRLFLTLFSLMVTSGLPELTSLDDLEYLRYALAVEKTEVEALRFFDQQFTEACSYAWRTRVDWVSHWLNT